MQITSAEIRQKYLDFFKSKNHAILESAPLVPENDPSVLFNTAGMQPLVPYLLGEKHPMWTRLADVQKCVRTWDIDDIGDNTHLSFFEMLGNWSLGDYFKEDSIKMSYELLTDPKWFGINPDHLAVTVFEWDENAPRDDFSAWVWKTLGIPESRISFMWAKDNWWAAGPTGPCGPDTEIFYWVGQWEPSPDSNVKNDENNWMEIWNNVFMEFVVKSEETVSEEIKKNLDDTTSLIIWEAIEIHKKYKSALTEKQINEILFDKLKNKWLKIEREKRVDIIEDWKKYWSRFIDLVVNDNIFIELKNSTQENEIKKWFTQVRSYLELNNWICGLLLNFAFSTLWINRFNNFDWEIFKKLLQTSKISKLPQQNVDTGMWLERITAVLNGKKHVFETDIFEDVLLRIKQIVWENNYNEKSARIIADHIRSATHMISDWVVPKNVDQGYILRRLIRRAIREFYKMWYEWKIISEIGKMYIGKFSNVYLSVKNNQDKIIEELDKEEEKFGKTLKNWEKHFYKLIENIRKSEFPNRNYLTWLEAFDLFQTYGFPVEIIEEMAFESWFTERWLAPVSRFDFQEEMKKHQELSRTASEWKFKWWLATGGEMETKYHTATHMLLSWLRKVLGNHVFQAGSNITAERLRFDFTHWEKVTPEQLKEVEDFVNSIIESWAQVELKEMKKDEAKWAWIVWSFWEKYPEVVKIYTIKWNEGTVYSQELCWGPHMETISKDNFGTFKIQKEEASSSGVRRIKAVLE